MVALIEETAANNLTVGNLTSGQRAWPPALEFSRQTQIGPADGHSNLGRLRKTTMRAQPWRWLFRAAQALEINPSFSPGGRFLMEPKFFSQPVRPYPSVALDLPWRDRTYLT